MKMKRYFALALAFVMIFVFVGCGSTKYTAPIQIQLFGYDGTGTVVDDFDSERLLEILNEGEWRDGLCDCINEFTLTVNDNKIGYNVSCGTFNNTTNGTSLVLDDATADELWEIFKSVLSKFENQEQSQLVDCIFDHEADIPYMLEGEVMSVSSGSITVKTELYDGLGIVVSTNFLEGYGYKSDISNIAVGDRVRVLYDGKVAESYPPQILSVYSINKVE